MRNSFEAGGSADNRVHIPECSLNEFPEIIAQKVEEIRQSSRRKLVVVAIAGSSASGKSEAAELLAMSMRQERVLPISTDDYYLGVSGMLVNKLRQRGDVFLPEDNCNGVLSSIREVTGKSPFDKKFNEDKWEELRKELRDFYWKPKINKIVEALREEVDQLHFDNPKAVDLNRLNRDLASLGKGELVRLPSYSMMNSEPAGGRVVDGAKVDIALVEGIYALNNEVAERSQVKVFVNARSGTVVSRRMRRDAGMNNRIASTPERTLSAILKHVIPNFGEHILPDKAKADLILLNGFTRLETFHGNAYDVQDKVKLEGVELNRLKEMLGEPVKVCEQKDFYFPYGDPENHLVVREENGRLKSLVRKGERVQRDDGKTIRSKEVFVNEGEFTGIYKNTQDLLNDFAKAGFKAPKIVQKSRAVYKIEGFDDLEIFLDEVEGLGAYLEICSNDKLSKSPNIEELKTALIPGGRKSVGPYIDELAALGKNNPEQFEKDREALNKGVEREIVLREKLCEVVEENEIIKAAFANLRRGYPEGSMQEQCKGREFRENAEVILQALAEKTLNGIEAAKVVVLMPWRSGLAFGQSYKERNVGGFYHLSSRRDEESLKTIVDYQAGKVKAESVVVIADPMLATGNTVIDAIERMIKEGVKVENIIVNAVVAAPVGVANVKKLYPEVRVVVGSLDEKLDHRGYIVPGLGDFGDKYCKDFSPEELASMLARFDLDQIGFEKMVARIKSQGQWEILSRLIEGDWREAEIDEQNKFKLKGLERGRTGEKLRLDTGRMNGVDQVVGIIKGKLKPETRVIGIEGKSGTGKSATAKDLSEAIGGQIISLSEIFRYLNDFGKGNLEELTAVAERLHFEMIEGKLRLFDGENGVVYQGKAEYDELIKTAELMQREVIKLAQSGLEMLKSSGESAVIEGRPFTLGYLPVDLRVELVTDPAVRAERKWNGKYF
jgi:uracil phosphoribosyltransferase